MKMDMVNYTIQSLQPQLQEHSIQFERAQFQEQLNKEPSTYTVLMEAGTACRLGRASPGRRLLLYGGGGGGGKSTNQEHLN